MARKKNTETAPFAEGTEPVVNIAEQAKSALDKVREVAFEKGRKAGLAEAKQALAEAKDGHKKEVSDLKNFLKAKYQDGLADGYKKGYDEGVKAVKQAAVATIKGL